MSSFDLSQNYSFYAVCPYRPPSCFNYPTIQVSGAVPIQWSRRKPDNVDPADDGFLLYIDPDSMVPRVRAWGDR